MKPTNQLTELSIKQAKPKEKQYKLTDGEGMYLRVYPNGSKYWQLQYWFDGKQKILSIGVWPNISLIDAREKRYEAKKKIKDGINPIEEKRKERQDHLVNLNLCHLCAISISERTGMSVSQVTDEVLYTGLVEMQEL